MRWKIPLFLLVMFLLISFVSAIATYLDEDFPNDPFLDNWTRGGGGFQGCPGNFTWDGFTWIYANETPSSAQNCAWVPLLSNLTINISFNFTIIANASVSTEVFIKPNQSYGGAGGIRPFGYEIVFGGVSATAHIRREPGDASVCFLGGQPTSGTHIYTMIYNRTDGKASLFVDGTLICSAIDTVYQRVNFTILAIRSNGLIGGAIDKITIRNDTPIITIPVESDIIVVNGSLNFTSDGGQLCGFDGSDYIICGPTLDTTPTFTYQTVGSSDCMICNKTLAWSSSDNVNCWNASTTGGTNHINTVGDALNVSTQDLYISCKSGGFEESDFTNANAFNISIEFANMKLDGVNESRTYEYQTTASLSTNIDFISVYDDTSRFINQSSPLNYLIDILRWTIFDQQIGIDGTYNISIDNRTELWRTEFNISGSEIGNLTLNYTNGQINFPGILRNEELTQTDFIFDDVIAKTHNVSFRSAEIKTIFLNYSSEGNASRSGFFNFSIIGFALDDENEFNYSNRFNESTNPDGTINNGTHSPIGEGNLNQTFEPFTNNATAIHWKGDGIFQIDVEDDTCFESLMPGGRNCILIVGGDPNNRKEFYSDYVDLSIVNFITFQSFSRGFCNPINLIEFTDLSDNVRIVTGQTGCSPQDPFGLLWNCNYTFTKKSEFVWNVDGVGNGDGGSGCINDHLEIDVSPLTPPYYIRMRNDAGESFEGGTFIYEILMKNLNYGGIYLNRTNVSFAGIEGVVSSNHTGNFTSHVLNTTSTSVTRATLTYNATIPINTSVTAYLSRDLNAEIWEEVINNVPHLFTQTATGGNVIRARFFLQSNSNFSSPLITSYSVQVISSELEGLEIDIGSDGIIETKFDFILNETSTPVGLLANDSSINRYIFFNCNGTSDCLIPISFISGSGGTIQIDNMNLTQNINPIRLDVSVIQELEDIHITSNRLVNLIQFKFDYFGSKNISVVGHNDDFSIFINHTLSVVYSPFNITFPSGQEFWQIFPNKRNQSRIEPFGQNTSTGIWQIDTTEYHNESIDIYARFNESVDACVTQTEFNSQNFTVNTNNSYQTLNLSNLTTQSQILIDDINLTLTARVWTYTTINCSASTSGFFIPYYCFFSICDSCVKTTDWESNCELEI